MIMPQLDPLKEAQKAILGMMVAVHKICEEHEINYWLTDGTLLGAIRHKGFIPWDDDADIAMMREDYNKFSRIIGKYLPHPFQLETEEVHIRSKHNWIKILYLEDFEWVDKLGTSRKGMSIDIFPFDFTRFPDRSTRLEGIVNTIAMIESPVKIENIKDKLRRVINYTKIQNCHHFLSKETQNVTYGIETCFYGWAYFKVDDIFPLKKGTFEGKSFYIPHNYDSYLRTLYNEYMEIPRESERHTHRSKIRFTVE
jgi:lipopolysaccharide cholinephosphotransferase